MKKQIMLLFLVCFLSTYSAYAAQGTTPLMLAARDGNLNLAKELIQQGADVKATDEYGNTALTQAVINKNRALIALLLDHGADLFAANNAGEIPWIMALEDNDEDFIQFLRTYQPRKRDTVILGAAVHNYASSFEKR